MNPISISGFKAYDLRGRIPSELKYAFGIGGWILLAVYFLLAGRRSEHAA
jgi:hypothetical protein